MKKNMMVNGFSKRSKAGKLEWVAEHGFDHPEEAMSEYQSYWLKNTDQQRIYDRISENTISNFILPYGVAPNFVINEKSYTIPMVIEESSVVAAACNAAKFWMHRGGFQAKVLNTRKVGQIHFNWNGERMKLLAKENEIFESLKFHSTYLSENMNRRGGGLKSLQIRSFEEDPEYYQFLIEFETCDSMGANYINSVLENFASKLDDLFTQWLGTNC